MIKKIAIFGYGYVGQAMWALLKDKYEMAYQDLGKSEGDVEGADMAIVCVPTPMAEDGACDTSIVEEVIATTEYPLYLIKSAVPPGTTEMLSEKYCKNIVVSPEYLGEGNYPIPHWKGLPHPTDAKLHDFQIFGGEKELTKKCVGVFAKVYGPHCRFYQTDSRTVELVKYMENCWIATKVVFCHEFSQIAEAFDRDYMEVRELWLADGRVGRSASAVFPGRLGFSGKCLPKDTAALRKAAKDVGYFPRLLDAVIETNKELRSSVSG